MAMPVAASGFIASRLSGILNELSGLAIRRLKPGDKAAQLSADT
jgi:hypothetical protein